MSENNNNNNKQEKGKQKEDGSDDGKSVVDSVIDFVFGGEPENANGDVDARNNTKPTRGTIWSGFLSAGSLAEQQSGSDSDDDGDDEPADGGSSSANDSKAPSDANAKRPKKTSWLSRRYIGLGLLIAIFLPYNHIYFGLQHLYVTYFFELPVIAWCVNTWGNFWLSETGLSLATWLAGLALPTWFYTMAPALGAATAATGGFVILIVRGYASYVSKVMFSTHGMFSTLQCVCLNMVTLGYVKRAMADLKFHWAVDSGMITGDGWQRVNPRDAFKIPGRIHILDGDVSVIQSITDTFWRSPNMSYPYPHIVFRKYWKKRPMAVATYTFITVPHMVWTSLGSFVIANLVLFYAVFKLVRWSQKQRSKEEVQQKFEKQEALGSYAGQCVAGIGALPFVASLFAKKGARLDIVARQWQTCAHLVDAIDCVTGKVTSHSLKKYVNSIIEALNFSDAVKDSLILWFYFAISIVLTILGVRTVDTILKAEYLTIKDSKSQKQDSPTTSSMFRTGKTEAGKDTAQTKILPPIHMSINIDHKERTMTNNGDTIETCTNNYTIQFENLLRQIKQNQEKTEALIDGLEDKIIDLADNNEEAIDKLKKQIDGFHEEGRRKITSDKRSVAGQHQADVEKQQKPTHEQDAEREIKTQRKSKGKAKLPFPDVEKKNNAVNNRGFIFGYEDFDIAKLRGYSQRELDEAKRIHAMVKSGLAEPDTSWNKIYLNDVYPGFDERTWGQILANVETFLYGMKEFKSDQLLMDADLVIELWTLPDRGYVGPAYLKGRAMKQGKLIPPTLKDEARKKRVRNAGPQPSTSTPSGDKMESINYNNPYITDAKDTKNRNVILHDEAGNQRGHGIIVSRTVNGSIQYYVCTANHVMKWKPTHITTFHGAEQKLGGVARVNQDKCWVAIKELPPNIRPTKMKIAKPEKMQALAHHFSAKEKQWVLSTGHYNPVEGGDYPSEDGDSGMGIFDAVDMHCIGIHRGDKNDTTRSVNLWDEEDLLWVSGQGEGSAP